MANPSGGNKFVSVNLNKSYGQQQHHHSTSYSSRTARAPNSYHHGGGGMVVLSRPRSSQKNGPKLSIPPPMNLPSLKKEHEKFDSLGTGGGPIGGGIAGSGLRPSSSGMGWTKPVMQEKEDLASAPKGALDHDIHIGGVDGLSNKGMRALMHYNLSVSPSVTVERSPVLRGEDFPSLVATLPVAQAPPHKLKDRSAHKPKQVESDVGIAADGLKEGPNVSSHVDLHPQQMSSRRHFSNGLRENESENTSLGISQMREHSRMEDDYFAGPLPLVRLNPRSDWADDERDTGHGLLDRGKDHGFLKSDAYWEGDIDVLKTSYLPTKSGNSYFDQWTLHDSETENFSPSQVPKAGLHGRDARTPSREGREGNSWRASSPLSKDNVSLPETGIDRSRFSGRASSIGTEMKKDNKYVPSLSRDGLQNEANSQGVKLPWNNTRGRYGNDSILHHSIASKSSVGSRGSPFNDIGHRFTKDKRLMTKNEKPYSEEPILKDFGDGWDHLQGNILGVVKRRKDVPKDTDFHDPVRESFEAELDRVQKMQEQERQRIIEEQERSLELTRREEEERARLAREQEEMQRKLEEEAREAAWKAEQERLEALHRAEEQRLAREEEKRKILMEEERRKQAAKQKLLELEEKIAKRQADAVNDCNKSSLADGKVAELVKDSSRLRETENSMSDGGDWEDSERMPERTMTSASSDSSLSKPFEVKSRSNISKGSSSVFIERGKSTSTSRRDTFENGNSTTFPMKEPEGGVYGPKLEPSFGGKSFSRNEIYGGAGFGTSRNYSKGRESDFQMDGYSQSRGQRWNLANGDTFSRNTDVDTEFPEDLADKFGDVWGQGRPHNNLYPLHPDQYYHHEVDSPYSSGRSRHSMRQPRVPPPLSLASTHNRRGDNERPGPSSLLDGIPCDSTGRGESNAQMDYDSSRQENAEMVSINTVVEQKPDQGEALRCDSQSSLSVSSPPDSPVHISHDDLDEFNDYPLKSAAEEDDDFLMNGETGQVNIMTIPSSASSGVDDREWTLDNNSGLQEQEEYDEDELGYREDDVREGEDEHIHLSQEFEDMHLEDKTSAIMMDISVLCIRNDARVQLTNDELEVSSRKDVGAFPSQMVSAEGMESLKRDDLTHLHGEASPQVTIKSQENETFMPAAVTKTSDNLDDNSRSHALSSYQAAPSGSTSTVLQSAGHTIMPSAPSFPTQAEIPVKLQFGLFSGPSLIPTPVPAIQIGSIQMPLHLHPHPLGQPVHPSQSPIFQFGQLRYTSPVSHGAVSLTPQSMSFLHPSIPANFPFNKNPDGPMSTQTGEDDSAQNLENMKNAPSSMSIRQGLVSRPSDLSEGNVPVEVNPLPARERRDHFVVSHSGREEQVDEKEVAKKNRPLSKSKEWEDQAKIGAAPVQLGKQDRDFAGSKFHGSVSSNRGKHYIFKVKNDASKTSFLYSEASQSDGSGYQRRPRHLAKRAEFRVRDNSEKRQAINFGSADQLGLEDRSNMNGKNVIVHARSGTRKATNNRVTKYSLDSEGKASGSTNIQELPCGNEVDGTRRESSIKGQVIQHSHSIEGSNKRDTREEDVDTSLQSGVVRVFEQPGIEAPSDEDDFIEVRSKRQMLNDKREQREKEIKAKSRISKAPRRSRSFLKHTASPSLKTTVISGEGAGSSIHTDFAATEARKLADFEVSSGFNPNLSSQQLAPISMPPAKDDISADLRDQNCMTCPDVAFKDNNVDDVQTSLDSWVEHPGINQPVMALTQSQLDEAMKPANFDSRISVCDHTTAVSEHIIPSSSILVKDSQFSSAAASISSLLDGEKIQFGAVTTPTVLLPSAHLGSHGIGSPGSCQLDIQMPNTIIPAKSNCSIFLKEKSDESCAHFEDCEAEAEAAASAVAVAAISNDEIIGKGLGTCSLSVSDTKSYGAANEGGIAAGVSGDQQSENQSRAEETLSVSLPADLSVETPPMSLWPPLTPSQTTSTQMLSHFPSAPPPHLSFYDMNVNTMMGSPIFAFGPNEDTSSAPQSHAQKNSTPSSGTHATWHHSGMESFYGSPAGFTGPFIGPGGIAGVQAPPHMVVYNHFAPVGQFGQVGLSFMGTTLIQSGKQPDWKHNPSRPCTTSVGEGDVNDINVLSTQRNAIGMPSPVQHLAPGSPMLPVASPLPMFDVAPFQSSTEVPIHARWSHLPSSTFHSIPMSMPMQQQTEGLLPLLPQYPNKANNVPPPVEQSEATNKPGEGNQDYRLGAATGPTATQLPDELGLVEESSGSSFPGTSKHVHVAANSASDSGHISTLHGNKNQSGSSASIPFITRSRNSQHYGAPSSSSSGYSNNSHRRAAGYHGGRNHSFGSEKGLSSSTGRVKQIYVAKQRNQPAVS